MRQIRHPLSGALYDEDVDGNVLVTTRDGSTGRFRGDGTWLEGAVRHADPHLCQWVIRPNLMARHRQVAQTSEEQSS